MCQNIWRFFSTSRLSGPRWKQQHRWSTDKKLLIVTMMEEVKPKLNAKMTFNIVK